MKPHLVAAITAILAVMLIASCKLFASDRWRFHSFLWMNKNATDSSSILDSKSVRRIEPSLIKARASIRKAALAHRSYAEMEKRFKIFVYPEGDPPLVHNGPSRSIYSTEGRFIFQLELGESPFLTSDPDEAHVFFLPFSVTMMVAYLYKPKVYEMSKVRLFVKDYIDVVANKYAYWNRSLGADHFMLSCHDWGPIVSLANPFLYSNSIRVLCNANSSEGFNPMKDVPLPEMNLRTDETVHLFQGGRSASERPILAFFAGGNHGPVRPILFRHWHGRDEEIQIHEYLPRATATAYYDFMNKSRYCVCPSGYEVASPRIVEAIYSECVPVLISEHYVLPFSDVLKWEEFSVKIALSDIPKLKSILESIGMERYVKMQSNVKKVKKHFVINERPTRYDMFHMILHSIWLRRLNIYLPS